MAWFTKPPPAPAPAPLPEPNEAWYATTILLYVFAAWGALSILTYLLPLLLSLVGRRVPNLRNVRARSWFPCALCVLGGHATPTPLLCERWGMRGCA